MNRWVRETPDRVLEFWFPPGLDENNRPSVLAFFDSRMHGGMDAAIVADFADLTEAAAKGFLDHWSETAEGRLALIIALDQFPRSLWRDTPAAFGQDIKATRLALEGLENGDFGALPGRIRKPFYLIAIAHCEGPDHLARMDLLVRLSEEDVSRQSDPDMRASAEAVLAQTLRIRGVIQRFGRHPHRNQILGRVSTPEEEAYIKIGEFPHLRGNPKEAE